MSNLADTWIKHQQTNDLSLFDAWEALNDMVFNHPENAWKVILEILDKASSDDIVASLGAGPLEDLLSEHGDMFIDEVEIKTRQEPKFTKLILCVWEGGMSKEIWSRVSELQKKYEKIV